MGAHFTPRAHVERLVRATIEEPLRAQWTATETRVHELVDPEAVGTQAGQAQQKQAIALLYDFLRELTQIRVLDPACGTGNFLYVAYVVLKELEGEALAALVDLAREGQEGLHLEHASVHVGQMLGLEVKPWAAEIAQLVLWIGHLQWELKHAGLSRIADPVLPTGRSIECRDALIRVGRREAVLDAEGRKVSRWDGEHFKIHPVTGKSVPDERATVVVEALADVDVATWPSARFIVGNPPFLGNKHMRAVLGDAYVDAVRGAYPDVADTVDFVMYWWHRAATLARTGAMRRFGLITTNSLKQTFNRQVTEHHLSADPPLRLTMAVPDHPWVDRGADVRISMTVGEAHDPAVPRMARLVRVVREAGRDEVEVAERAVRRIHADLRTGADVASAVKLRANTNISFQGMNLVGKGFRLEAAQIEALGFDLDDLPPIIRPHLNAREMMRGGPPRYVIDAYGLSVDELRSEWPTAYQWLYDHVKPERDHNRRASRRDNWWIFGEPVGKLRRALDGLKRFIATPETSKHRVFDFFDVALCPDHKLYAIALEDDASLGILSSRVHEVWALRAGGRMGVGNDPTYNNTRCFLTFPFPEADAAAEERIASAGRRLCDYRHSARRRSPALNLTLQYNLLAALREGREFTKSERKLHNLLATAELARLHDELDDAVFAAYGWPRDLGNEDLLERLLELNAERAAEEAAGLMRWLRRPDDAPSQVVATPIVASTAASKQALAAWPTDPVEQVTAILVRCQLAEGPFDAESIAAQLKNARRARVKQILDVLAERQLILRLDAERFVGNRLAA